VDNATKSVDEFTLDSMAQMMVGRELSDFYPPMNEADVDAEIVLDVRNLNTKNLKDVSFRLRKGEVLGFAGLIGSGRTELFEAICSLEERQSGAVQVFGKQADFSSPAEARDAGIVYLTKDRKAKGLLMEQGMLPNMTLFALPKFTRRFMLDHAAERTALERGIRRFDIRARNPNCRARELSGGNQQKLLLAKIMEADPRIVIIDEPTRGIDVGTKQQIYHFIAALAAEGMSVVVISSEMPEIIGICHRVLVMRSGRITGELTGDAINENEIVRYAAGLKEETAHG
jgi:ribose transport system ATP-binding protein